MNFCLVKYWLALTVLVVAFPVISNAQDQRRMTRQEFSRLSVLARSAYFENAILNAARREGVDPNCLGAIAYNETRFRPWLTSPKGAKGLMQFIPATARRFGLNDPYDPKAAIDAAALYVKYLSGLFGGRLDSILAAYNAGEGTVSAFLSGRPLRIGTKIINPAGRRTIGGVPPYNETIEYVGRGLKVYHWLQASRKFPDTNIKTSVPNIVTETIAQVPLIDPELGKMQVFPSSVTDKTVISRRTTAVRNAVVPDERKEREVPSQKILEVYYDPRSGKRFEFNGESGKTMANLRETGPVIVSNDTRTGILNRARTTFVGGWAKK